MIDRRRIAFRSGLGVSMVLMLGSLVVSGCGGGEETESGLVPVKGRVTLDGGPWPKAGSISFVPKDAPKASLTGIGTFDTTGNFDSVIGGYGGSTGLHPGMYWAYVNCSEGADVMPIPGKKVETKEYVPQKFRDPSTSGLTLEVVAGKPAEVAFDVKTK